MGRKNSEHKACVVAVGEAAQARKKDSVMWLLLLEFKSTAAGTRLPRCELALLLYCLCGFEQEPY